jgi:hypothetical protein
MDFDRLRDAWNQQPDAAPSRTDNEWIRLVLTRDRSLRRRIRTRDCIELGTAWVMAAGFGWMAAGAPVRWPWLAAAGIMLALGAVFVRERLRHRPPTDRVTHVGDTLTQALAEVDHQIRLLASVLLWYLLPLGVVIVLIDVGAILDRGARMDPAIWAREWPSFLLPFALVIPVIAGTFWVVWWANQRAVRRDLLPHRAELVRVIHQLAVDDEEEGRR